MTVGLDDLKTHLNITRSTDDDELLGFLDSATELVESLVGPISVRSVTETHYGLSSDTLVLRQMPVEELTAVSSRFGATTTALTLADYEADPATGIVRAASGARFCGNYTVVYTVGRDQPPASINLAILLIAAHLWDTQRGAAPTGPLSAAEDATLVPGLGYAIPNRARELLQPYVQIAFA